MKTLRVTHEQIAERAFQIYQANGCRHGHDKDDWLQAEYELMGRPVKVKTRFHGHHFPIAVAIAVVKGAIVLSQIN
ncbi:MAG TPA: DUF2934 domain-containing protein [Verrucomicrobiae bacterium]|nr:DUF2934 domain-containing protein [Verrucomicrobiae bacterium]